MHLADRPLTAETSNKAGPVRWHRTGFFCGKARLGVGAAKLVDPFQLSVVRRPHESAPRPSRTEMPLCALQRRSPGAGICGPRRTRRRPVSSVRPQPESAERTRGGRRQERPERPNSSCFALGAHAASRCGDGAGPPRGSGGGRTCAACTNPSRLASAAGGVSPPGVRL